MIIPARHLASTPARPAFRTGRRHAGARRRRAFILVIVMIVIMMLTLAGLSFVLNLTTENKAVHLQGTQLQLKQTMASGVELLRAVLDQSAEQREQEGGLRSNQSLFFGVDVPALEHSLEETGFSVVSPVTDGERGDNVRYGLQNESIRLNLGVLLDWERDHPGSASEALMNLPGMSEAMADAILDWIDPDDSPRPAGAEEAYYAGRGLPYGPRNGIPAVLEELLLVRDIARLSLLGPDIDLNYRVDTRERNLARDSPVAGDETPWAWLLTVHSAERNQTHEGEPRIYLNEPDLEELHEALVEAFDESSAEFVIAYRQFGPYDSSLDFAGSSGSSSSSSSSSRSTSRGGSGRTSRRQVPSRVEFQLDLSLPAQFEIDSVLDLLGIQIAVPAQTDQAVQEEDERILLDSPFSGTAEGLRDALAAWMDRTTTRDEPVIRGRINVNQASREVLLGVPGLDSSLVEQIIAARPSTSDRLEPAQRHPTWLLTEGLVDRDQMRDLLPYLTCGGDVYRGQVVAFDRNSGLTARGEVVLDATVSPPQQVYWKNLGLLGRGFTASEIGADSRGRRSGSGNVTISW